MLKAMLSLPANTPRVWWVLGGRWRKCCPASGHTSTSKGQAVMPWRMIQGSHKDPSGTQAGTSQPVTLHRSSLASWYPSAPAQILNPRTWLDSSLPAQVGHCVPTELPRALPQNLPCPGTQTWSTSSWGKGAHSTLTKTGATTPWNIAMLVIWADPRGEEPPGRMNSTQLTLSSALEVFDLDLSPAISLHCWNFWWQGQQQQCGHGPWKIP